MEEIKVKKYPKIRSLFKRDDHFKFTDQYISASLQEFSEQKFQWSCYEKIDGTNIRIYCNYETNEFKYLGRTDKADMPTHLTPELDKMIESVKSNKEAIKQALQSNIFVLFGEGFGHKIQKGGLYLGKDTACHIFDSYIYYVTKEGHYKGFWLDEKRLDEILNILQLEKVPFIGHKTTAEAVEMAKKGFDSKYGTAKSEGLILKTHFPVFDSFGNRLIFKVKTKDFA